MITIEKFMQRLATPEIFTPKQWAEFWGLPKDIVGNKLFALSMLKSAWDDVQLEPKNRQQTLDRQSALDWIRGVLPGRLPLTNCCEMLGINPDWLRKGLLARAQNNLQPKSPRFSIKTPPSPHHTAMHPNRAAMRAARLAVLKLYR